MSWIQPALTEITLGLEATAYVNTDDAVRAATAPAEETPAAPPPEDDEPSLQAGPCGSES